MSLAREYYSGLKQAYLEVGGKEFFEVFESIITGATSVDMERLRTVYPQVPDSLLNLLQIVDGTYFRSYEKGEVLFFFLGSDVEGYPYYLLSTDEIIQNQNMANEYYGDYINREYDLETVKMDDRIVDDSRHLRWLHFADCMNNGGTSQLFIDFSPSSKGMKGQVVRFLHDPDNFEVIANSFDDYLELLMKNEYDFISEDTIECL